MNSFAIYHLRMQLGRKLCFNHYQRGSISFAVVITTSYNFTCFCIIIYFFCRELTSSQNYKKQWDLWESNFTILRTQLINFFPRKIFEKFCMKKNQKNPNFTELTLCNHCNNLLCSKPQVVITARKTIFSFPKCSEKIVFLKKSHWNIIFLVSSRKMVFLFPESMMLFFRRKIKDDLSQKLHVSMTFSSNVLKRWSFQKIALEYDLSCIIRKDGICLSRKYDIFSMAENERWSISKNTWKYDVFGILDKDGIAFSYKL